MKTVLEVVWRCSGRQMNLDEALHAVSREVDARWRPGDLVGKRARTEAGFNVLVGRAEGWSRMFELIQGFVRDSGPEILAVAALGGSSELDVGVLSEPEERQALFPASLMRDLSALSVDLRISWYL